MSPNSLYASSSNRLLIIGQETKGWNYFVNDFERQMQTYEEFNVGDGYYSSPFWNVIRKVEKALGNPPHSCAWTNISKFDLDGGRSYDEYESTIANIDNILIEEVNIIKPDVCIFFTGPNFDHRVKGIFEGIKYNTIEDWSLRELAQLSHPSLPVNSFRTYHPNYLRRAGFESDFVKYIETIIAKFRSKKV